MLLVLRRASDMDGGGRGLNSGGLAPGSSVAKVAGFGTMVAGVATIVTALLGRIKFHDRSWVLTVGMAALWERFPPLSGRG